MKVANIVTDSKTSLPKYFNVVETMDEIIHGLPTLVLGFNFVDSIYPNFDVTNIKLGENIYWTVKKTEKRDKFQEDLNWFTNEVFSKLTEKLTYLFIDPIHHSNKQLVKIVRKIHSIENLITYHNDNILFLYGDNLIFGIDLRLIKFVGLDNTKIKNKIKSISKVFLDNTSILIEYKNIAKTLGYSLKYIPYLYSILNEQKNTISDIHLRK